MEDKERDMLIDDFDNYLIETEKELGLTEGERELLEMFIEWQDKR